MPNNPQAAKLANKFIGIMSKAREAIDLNETLHEYPTCEPGSANPFASENFEADLNDSDDLSFVSDESYTDAEN